MATFINRRTKLRYNILNEVHMFTLVIIYKIGEIRSYHYNTMAEVDAFVLQESEKGIKTAAVCASGQPETREIIWKEE